jgi:hypothetical protein
MSAAPARFLVRSFLRVQSSARVPMYIDSRLKWATCYRFLPVFLRDSCGSARINLGKEEVRCSGWKLFDGIQRVRLPPGKG